MFPDPLFNLPELFRPQRYFTGQLHPLKARFYKLHQRLQHAAAAAVHDQLRRHRRASRPTLQITFALLAAYAVVFIPFRGKKIIFLIMMATMMIPGEVLVISNFQTIRSWNLLNTFPA
ncbi:MAG: hypothetical protein V8S74_05860 [Lachnospirales bacterium]